MATLARATIENTLIPNLLTFFRTHLSDPLSRNNTGWIRSESQVRAGFNNNSTSTGVTGVTVKDLSRKRGIIKESQKVGYPEVIIGNYTETNSHVTIGGNYETEGTVIITIKDTGNVNRIGNIAGQISSIIKTKSSTLKYSYGIHDLTWTSAPTDRYFDDDNEYNTKDITLDFKVLVTDD